jgi:hypothetical protein
MTWDCDHVPKPYKFVVLLFILFQDLERHGASDPVHLGHGHLSRALLCLHVCVCRYHTCVYRHVHYMLIYIYIYSNVYLCAVRSFVPECAVDSLKPISVTDFRSLPIKLVA